MKTSKFMAVVGAAAMSLALSSASQASSFTIFTENFDSPSIQGNWQVFQDFNDWNATSGTGIEIQKNGAVGGVVADSGDQYVELDSDPSRGGLQGEGTNSSMTLNLVLGVGTHTLQFAYQPRTNTEGDNGIDVFLDKSGTTLLTNLIDSVSEVRSTLSTWTVVTTIFTVNQAGGYGLSFAATGLENKLGGFIDTVSLAGPQGRVGEVPLPAAAWLFLSAFGAGGLLRRFKRQS